MVPGLLRAPAGRLRVRGYGGARAAPERRVRRGAALRQTFELEGGDKPACVTDSILRFAG
jgi:hypothetical protein